MDATVVEKIGGVSHFASVDRRNRTRPRRISRCGPARIDDDQPSVVGHRLPADFWAWNRCGDDADHGRDRAALRLFDTAFHALESRARDGFRIGKRRVWIISLLSDWNRPWIVFWPSDLDPAVIRAVFLVAQASQAAEKVEYFVIPSEARNLSGF